MMQTNTPMQCYLLVNSTSDKAKAWAQGVTVEIFAFGACWYLFTHRTEPPAMLLWMIALLYGIAALVIGPMVLIDALTRHVRITDQGISIASSVFRPKKPWIYWESLTKVDVRSNPVRPSVIEKVILSERYKVSGYWKTRRLTIPGNQPDLPSILQIIRETVPDKFIG